MHLMRRKGHLRKQTAPHPRRDTPTRHEHAEVAGGGLHRHAGVQSVDEAQGGPDGEG